MRAIRIATIPAVAALLLADGCATSEDQTATPMQPMSFDAELNTGFDESIDRVTAALQEEGFGVITRVDLHTTFANKLGIDMPPHTILGACNPKLAHKAVTAMPEASLMLPCNVTVQQLDERRVIVRIVSPEAIMAGAGLGGDPEVRDVGAEAQLRLKRVADALTDRSD